MTRFPTPLKNGTNLSGWNAELPTSGLNRNKPSTATIDKRLPALRSSQLHARFDRHLFAQIRSAQTGTVLLRRRADSASLQGRRYFLADFNRLRATPTGTAIRQVCQRAPNRPMVSDEALFGSVEALCRRQTLEHDYFWELAPFKQPANPVVHVSPPLDIRRPKMHSRPPQPRGGFTDVSQFSRDWVYQSVDDKVCHDVEIGAHKEPT